MVGSSSGAGRSGRLETGSEFQERYTVRSTLGQGGMGVVYRAWDAEARREVALKVLLGSSTPERIERFQREGALCASLDHPAIVKVHAAGVSGAGRPYLVYELIEGARPLDEALLGLTLPERVSVIAQVARALGHAHARGVVHRDVKPQNVLIGQDGRARLTDFGLATASDLERLTRTGALLGTPSYMAPEQLDSSERATPASDVWSLGVLLYQALTDHLPFAGATLPELAGQLISARPRPPRELAPAVPIDLERICLVALRRAPSERYPDADALAADLERHLAGQAIQGVRRPRRAAGLLLGGVVLGGGTAAALLWPGTSVGPRPEASPPASAVVQRSAPDPGGPEWFRLLDPCPRLPEGVVAEAAPGMFRATKDGSPLAWVPPGAYPVGEVEADRSLRHRYVAQLQRGLFIGRHEVSLGQYTAFCELTGRSLPPSALDVGGLLEPIGPTHPIMNVSWEEAMAYAEWVGGRLPTRVEWEAAGRGPAGLLHPWGDEPRPELANLSGAADGFAATCPVDALPAGASPFGCLNLIGNAAEWTLDGDEELPADPRDPRGPMAPEEKRILRGGSYTSQKMNRLNQRGRRHDPHARDYEAGFRLAFAPPP